MKQAKLDPVRYEIFFNKLDQSVNEAQVVVRLLAGSTIVKEAGEAAAGFFLPEGDSVDIACGILMHFLNVTRVIQYMSANRYDAEDIGIYDGDQFINNDAYVAGMHVPDIAMVAPFYYQGELLGYTASIAHTTEIGAVEPGGQPPSATEAVHDGLHIPIIKLIERGRIRRDLWNLLLRGTRNPTVMELDLKARIAGNERLKARLKEIVDEFGVDFFKQACRQLIKDGELFFKEKVKRLRPGIYTSRVFVDTVSGSPAQDRLSVVQVDMEVREDGTMLVDLPIVSPQQRGYNNAYLPAVEATIMYCFLTQINYESRWNSGMINALEVRVPEKSRLNADENQSVAYATVGIAMNFASALTETLSRAYYTSGIEEEVQAPPTWSVSPQILSGLDAFGRYFAHVVFGRAYSGGATLHRDGFINYIFFNPWLYACDVEADEMLTNGFCLYFNFIPDTGGLGKYRGGVTRACITMIHKSNSSYPVVMGSGSRISGAQGMFGGYPGPVSKQTMVTDTNLYQLIQEGKKLPQDFWSLVNIDQVITGNISRFGGSASGLHLKAGDLVISWQNAGSGMGDPIERDPYLVRQDVMEGKATLPVAENVYAVAIDPKTLEIDGKETEKRRQRRREERLSSAIPGSQYLKLLVESRKRRQLPQPTLKFLDELQSFSPAFRAQLDREEGLARTDLVPLKRFTAKNVLLRLTPYVNIAEDENGNKAAVCSQCGFAYCPAGEDYKLYCLIRDRDAVEVYPSYMAPDKDWGVYREFYCPGCGTQVEVENTPLGMPIIPNTRLKGIHY